MMKTAFFVFLFAAGLPSLAQEFSFSTSPEAKTSLAFFYDDKNITGGEDTRNTSVTAQFAGDKLLFFTPASITVWDAVSKKQINQLTLDRLRKVFSGFPHYISFTDGAPSNGVVFKPRSMYSNYPFVTTSLPDTIINFNPDAFYNVHLENLDNRNFHFWHKAGEQLRDYFYDAQTNSFYYHRHEWARPFATTDFNIGGSYRFDDLSRKEPTAAHLFSLESKAGSDIYFADLTIVIYNMALYFYANESRRLIQYTDGTGQYNGIPLKALNSIALPHSKKKGYYLWSSAFEFPYVWLTYGSNGNEKDQETDINFVEVNMLTNSIERQQSVQERTSYEAGDEKVFGYRNVWHVLASLYADSLKKNIQPDVQEITVSSTGDPEICKADAGNQYSLKKTAKGKVTVESREGKKYFLNLEPDQALLTATINAAGDKMAVAIGKKALSTALKNTNRRFYFYDTYYYLVDLNTNTVSALMDPARYKEQINQLTDSHKPAGKYFDPYKIKY